MNRRSFLASASALVASQSMRGLAPFQVSPGGPKTQVKADHNLRIEPCTLEIGKGISIKTMAYNGQVPGPLLRLKQGVPVTIDVTNASTVPEITHWHGLTTDPINDGAMEEGSPMIAVGATQRYMLKPEPTGTRWYHTHAGAFDNLGAGTYSGQFGFLQRTVRFPPGRRQRNARALRPGDQPRHPSLGAVVCSHG